MTPKPCIGICFSCKKKKIIHDFSGLKICNDCEDLFYKELIDKYKEEEYGRDLLNDEKSKKSD